MPITFDIINNINCNPINIFGDIKFKLKKFDFDKDLLFQNMHQIKNHNDDFSFLCVSYEFNFENIIDKLKELFPTNVVEINSSMFAQLYLHLIKNDLNKNFIFKRKKFESFDHGSAMELILSHIDQNSDLLYVLYIENYKLNELLKKEKYLCESIILIKIGSNEMNYPIYCGLTEEGIKFMTILEWSIYPLTDYRCYNTYVS